MNRLLTDWLDRRFARLGRRLKRVVGSDTVVRAVSRAGCYGVVLAAAAVLAGLIPASAARALRPAGPNAEQALDARFGSIDQ